MVQLIGAPFDLCGMQLGSRLGPAAIRLAGLAKALEDLGLEVADAGDVPVNLNDVPGSGLRHFDALLECVVALRSQVMLAIERGRLPVVLGGEHTLAVSGISAALAASTDRLGVLWIDAHADVNTPGTSTTGNVHGMPLAVLWGLSSGAAGEEDVQWTRLQHALGEPQLLPEHTAWFGLRDVDPAERARLSGCAVTMHDVDRRGVEACVRSIGHWMDTTGIERLWVSFDVDALDPILAPGTGTAVRGGLSYREGHLLAELLHETLANRGLPLAGVDLVETNPLIDRHNETAQMAVEWIASLFGKTILGPTQGKI